MTIKEIVAEIAQREGKKREVSVGDIREIVGVISDLLYLDESVGSGDYLDILIRNGKRRSKRKK